MRLTMKLYVYGEFGPMALERSLLPHWEAAKSVKEVQRLERIVPLDKTDLLSKGVRRYLPALSLRLKRHNAEVLDSVLAGKSDEKTLIIFKGMELFPATLATLKANGVHLFCYNPDHPFIYSGPGSGTQFMREALPHYDGYFTYHRGAFSTLQERDVSVELVPFGYEEDAAQIPLVKEEDEIQRGCFIGNPNPQRIELFRQLEGHIPFDLYGAHWSKHFSNTRTTRIYDPVHGMEHARILGRYRFQFNAMALHNPDAHNMRSFAVPASGGIMLAPDTSDHRMFFEVGKEVFLFDNTHQCIEQALSLLRLTYAEALSIRKAARKRSVSSGYAYASRAEHMLEAMFRIVKANNQQPS